jgi:hypothetical protein
VKKCCAAGSRNVKKTSMSEMVRRALDDYLTDRTTKP